VRCHASISLLYAAAVSAFITFFIFSSSALCAKAIGEANAIKIIKSVAFILIYLVGEEFEVTGIEK
jgi:small neutral amino acid transporter SnatA (MarC family)